MFRCMTEVENKTRGIVVDFDNNRVLDTMINIGSNVLGNTTDKIKYVIEHNIIWIDKDHFGSEYNSKNVIQDVVKAWEGVLTTHEEYTVNALTKEFENVDLQLSNTDQKFLDNIIHLSKSSLNESIKMSDIDNGEDIPSGVKKTKQGGKPPVIEKNIHINFAKEVATPILKFLSILFFRDEVAIDIKTLLRMVQGRYRQVVIQYIVDIFSINTPDAKKIYDMFVELFSVCL